ncbi:hypothetical protein [Acerihabitans arboris]|uniref:Uncharacterized protein n=1 Tax=Acerihabitans arboris TaxID=2691583 RepID=A0A845SPV8_9GAMM|nr:hypothetical protein [Acerihabitans arboris]NDL64578.1 hypothetical protein [Acerihabitans arboris]
MILWRHQFFGNGFDALQPYADRAEGMAVMFSGLLQCAFENIMPLLPKRAAPVTAILHHPQMREEF